MVDAVQACYLSVHFFKVYPVGPVLETTVDVSIERLHTAVQIDSNMPVRECFVSSHQMLILRRTKRAKRLKIVQVPLFVDAIHGTILNG